MGGYVPLTASDQQEMLSSIGLARMEELYAGLPASLRAEGLRLPQGKSELEVRWFMENLAAENTVFPTVFRGAGAYRHAIPAIVKQVAAKESFVTAYTPYQAEISQGVLQMIFEYQTEICTLTGLAVANASLYDGASAAAEAAAMCRERGRTKTLLAATAHPDTHAVMQTYADSAGAPVETIPARDGTLDLAALAEMLDAEVACVYIQSPNYLGLFEEVQQAAALCHAAGAKLVMGCNPIALALFKTPGEMEVDIAVGEGQPLGMPLSFGGPYLGFIACRQQWMRRLPGRIVGETKDADGRRCYVLTLQAREQHIRREKAASSICSNEALCALTASVYMAAMGPKGMREAAAQSYAKAHYAADVLADAGFTRLHKGEFFNEFATACPTDTALLLKRLETEGILGGLPIEGGLLWCCTEMNTKEEIDRLAALCKEEVAG